MSEPEWPLDLKAIARQQTATRRRRLLRSIVAGRLPDRRATVTDGSLPGPAGPISTRVYRPRHPHRSTPLPCVVAFHGGGYILYHARQTDWLGSRVAVQCDAVVVSVDYRLAPQHPYPAAIEDGYAAYEAIPVVATDLGVDPRRLALMGDSSGGNLAAVVTLLARDRGGPPIAHQTLIYPSLDFTCGSPSLNDVDAAGDPVLPPAMYRAHLGLYLNGADPADPMVSPLLAPDLSGLPPALIQTAASDPLRDDGQRYADRLAAAGVTVRHTEYTDAPHGFYGFARSVPNAQVALAELCEEISSRLHPT